VTFDESNGSQGEQVDDVVGLEEPSSKAIKKLAIGEIKPHEQEDQDEDGMVFPSPSRTHSAAYSGNSGNQAGDSGSQVWSTRKEDRSIRDMIKNHHPIIKINLKMKKRLNKFNNKRKFLIQEYIKVFKMIIRCTTSLKASLKG